MGFGIRSFNPGDVLPPTEPSNVVATLSGSVVTVTWGASSDVAGVKHYLVSSTVDSTVKTIPVSSPRVTTFTIPTDGRTFVFRVRAVDNFGNTSQLIQSNAVGASGTDPVFVTAAVLPQVAPGQSFDVLLKAEDPNGDRVYATYGTPSVGAIEEAGQQPDGSWAWRWHGTAPQSEGDYGSSVITITDDPPTSIAQVTGLQSSGVGAFSAVLSWTAAVNAQSYEIERSVDQQAWTRIASPLSLTYADSGLSASTTYYYRVRGISPLATGPYSTTLQVDTTAAVQLPNAEADYLYRAGMKINPQTGLMEVDWDNTDASGVVWAHDFRYPEEAGNWAPSSSATDPVTNTVIKNGRAPDPNKTGYTTWEWVDDTISGSAVKAMDLIQPQGLQANEWWEQYGGYDRGRLWEIIGSTEVLKYDFSTTPAGTRLRGLGRIEGAFWHRYMQPVRANAVNGQRLGNGLPCDDRGAGASESDPNRLPLFNWDASNQYMEEMYKGSDSLVSPGQPMPGFWCHEDYAYTYGSAGLTSEERVSLGDEWYFQFRIKISAGRWATRPDISGGRSTAMNSTKWFPAPYNTIETNSLGKMLGVSAAVSGATCPLYVFGMFSSTVAARNTLPIQIYSTDRYGGSGFVTYPAKGAGEAKTKRTSPNTVYDDPATNPHRAVQANLADRWTTGGGFDAQWEWPADKWVTVMIRQKYGHTSVNPTTGQPDQSLLGQPQDTLLQIWVAEEGATEWTLIADFDPAKGTGIPMCYQHQNAYKPWGHSRFDFTAHTNVIPGFEQWSYRITQCIFSKRSIPLPVY